MSTVRADNYANRLGTSSIPVDTLLQGSAKATFNLNGTGTIAARDSFNVSSFVDNGVGDYTANWSVAMPNANYVPVGMATQNPPSAVVNVTSKFSVPPVVNSFNAISTQATATVDIAFIYVTVHGDPV